MNYIILILPMTTLTRKYKVSRNSLNTGLQRKIRALYSAYPVSTRAFSDRRYVLNTEDM